MNLTEKRYNFFSSLSEKDDISEISAIFRRNCKPTVERAAEVFGLMERRRYYVEKEVLDAYAQAQVQSARVSRRNAAGRRGPLLSEGCLRETTKEIYLVHYQGSVGQRVLAKFLLCNAPVVDEVCWKVARGPCPSRRS
jgi:hypothetical protein